MGSFCRPVLPPKSSGAICEVSLESWEPMSATTGRSFVDSRRLLQGRFAAQGRCGAWKPVTTLAGSPQIRPTGSAWSRR